MCIRDSIKPAESGHLDINQQGIKAFAFDPANRRDSIRHCHNFRPHLPQKLRREQSAGFAVICHQNAQMAKVRQGFRPIRQGGQGRRGAQRQTHDHFSPMRDQIAGADAVSYTHLDVYKRQAR